MGRDAQLGSVVTWSGATAALLAACSWLRDPVLGDTIVGMGIVVAGSAAAWTLLRSGRSSPALRVYLASLIVGLGWIAGSTDPTVLLVSVVGLCFTVVIAAAWERSRTASQLWTGAAIAMQVSVSLIHRSAQTHWWDDLVVLVLVPLGLMSLSSQARNLTRSLEQALTTSEIARSKLRRSNHELGVAVASNEESLSKLSTVVDNLSDGLVAVTVEGEVAIVNPALGRLLDRDGFEPGEALLDAVPDSLADLFRRCLDQKERVVDDLVVGDRMVLAAIAPISIHDSLWGAVALVRDVTLEREIDRMKSDFIAVVSHEMRTPLTSVLGFTKLTRTQLRKWILPDVTPSSPKVERAVRTVTHNLDVVVAEGERLTMLINDVLDLSKMESGQMEWSFEAISPSAVVQQAFDATQALFAAKENLTQRSHVPADLPDIRADRNRVIQVLVNLLGNAVKFTDAGEVEVAAEHRGDAIAFTVRDTGVGIGPADRESIFDKFKQVGDTLTDRPKGTGLGLPICREIVDQHGGEIRVESQLGAGTRFVFTLPLALSPSGV